MSEVLLSSLISLAILAALAIWVPTLHLCHGCIQRLRHRADEPQASAQPAPETSILEST